MYSRIVAVSGLQPKEESCGTLGTMNCHVKWVRTLSNSRTSGKKISIHKLLAEEGWQGSMIEATGPEFQDIDVLYFRTHLKTKIHLKEQIIYEKREPLSATEQSRMKRNTCEKGQLIFVMCYSLLSLAVSSLNMNSNSSWRLPLQLFCWYITIFVYYLILRNRWLEFNISFGSPFVYRESSLATLGKRSDRTFEVALGWSWDAHSMPILMGVSQGWLRTACQKPVCMRTSARGPGLCQTTESPAQKHLYPFEGLSTWQVCESLHLPSGWRTEWIPCAHPHANGGTAWGVLQGQGVWTPGLWPL